MSQTMLFAIFLLKTGAESGHIPDIPGPAGQKVQKVVSWMPLWAQVEGEEESLVIPA